MKVDKETLIKHHFWILLGTYAPLVLVALMMLWFGVSSTIGEKEKALKQTKDKLAAANKPDVKNNYWVDILQTKDGNLTKHKDVIWKQVWDAQAMLTTWPPAIVNAFPHLKDLYFLDELKPPQLKEKFINDTGGYRSQLDELQKLVDPVDSRGEGAVQFLGGWQKVLTHVPKWSESPLPSSEDIWLAQEDLWVQRELLLVVREANNFVADFKKSNKPPKPDFSQGEKDHQVFTSPDWKFDVAVTQDAVRWQITNISSRLLPLAMNMRVWLNGARAPTILWVDGEPLAPRQSSRWQSKPNKAALGRLTIDRAQLALNWRNAPVKRIDNINLYYNSHRTSHLQLKPPPTKEGEPGSESSGTNMAPGGGTADGAGGGLDQQMREAMQRSGGMRMGMGGMGGIGGTGAGMQPAGTVVRNRYLDVNQQVRRLAIGMVLIVDQSHIQDVLTAFANSRLRFQITQVHWNQFKGSVKPAIQESTGGGTGTMAGQPPSLGGGRSRGDTGSADGVGEATIGAGGPGMGVPRVPGGMGTDPGSTAVNFADDSSNLVELAVYGIASMYQKYPPKSEPPPGSDNTTESKK